METLNCGIEMNESLKWYLSIPRSSIKFDLAAPAELCFTASCVMGGG